MKEELNEAVMKEDDRKYDANNDGVIDEKEKMRKNLMIGDQDMLDENEFQVKVQGKKSKWQKLSIRPESIPSYAIRCM